MPAQGRPIYLSDLTRCEPGAAISDGPRKGHWQAVSYEAEGVSGHMLVAGVECDAPTLTLPLGVQGWHAIYLGAWTHWVDSAVKLKLTRDPCFTPIATSRPDWETSNYFASIGEVLWTVADLTDQELSIGQMSAGLSRRAGIAYVKLEPLSPSEVAAMQRDRARTDTRRLIAYNDAWSFVYSRGPTTREEILEEVEPFRGTDFHKLLWGIGGGSAALFLSEIGELSECGAVDDFQRIGDRHAAESFRALKRQGIDPLGTVIDHAHSLGLELHGSYRVGGWVTPPPEYPGDAFYRQHSEWRCVDRDGRAVSRMSYAFGAVRDLVISLFREVAERGADGVNLAYVRGLPCVLYEQPLVEGFQERYGEDPRELPEDDSRWLAYRATWMTEFMRALRGEMDEVGSRQGRRVQVSAYVLNDVALCLSYGLDVATWVGEGLVDFIIPYPWHGNMQVDLAAFAGLTRATGCRTYAEVLPRQMSPAEYRERALACYRAGVDGLAFWDTDTENRLSYKEQWRTLRRLGHEDELAGGAEDELPACRWVPLHSLGGHLMDKYSPYWSA